jgi:transcription elongation factor S-II
MNSLIDNAETFRKNIAKQINSILEINPDKSIGKNIERSVYNFTINESTIKNIIKQWDNHYFRIIYLTRLKSIITNLNKNTEFKQLVMNGSITFDQLSSITHQEINHRRWDNLIQQKIERDKTKYEVQKKINSEFTCFKCHSTNCDYYQLQTRSADEPMTTFVSCIECGNRWKC